MTKKIWYVEHIYNLDKEKMEVCVSYCSKPWDGHESEWTTVVTTDTWDEAYKVADLLNARKVRSHEKALELLQAAIASGDLEA